MKLRFTAVAAFATVALAAPAEAHLVTTGLGPVYDGITHLAVSPTDLLAVVAVALLAGLGGPTRGRALVATLPSAWLLGGLAGLSASEEMLLPLAVAVVLLLLGILVATEASLPRSPAIALTTVAGLLFGGLNGTALAASGTGALGLIGIVGAATVLVVLLTAAVASTHAPWQRIVVRVAGSWIAAIAILMLGWSLAG